MRECGDYIRDILDSIDAAEEFVKGMGFRDFENDRKTVYAVVRAIEIIGESAKNIRRQHESDTGRSGGGTWLA